MADTAPAPTRSTAPAPDTTRKALAEGVGTFILVFFAVGAAVFGIQTIGKLGVAVAFGFVLLALAYAIGPVSGCHVNPAVTLGLLMRKGITMREAVTYWIAQVIGGIIEVVMTFLLVLVVLLVTSRAAAPGFAGLAIGLVLTVIHLVGIPLDGTSVNPARSIGPALFNGGEPLAHVWMFIVAPLIGGAIAALASPYFETA